MNLCRLMMAKILLALKLTLYLAIPLQAITILATLETISTTLLRATAGTGFMTVVALTGSLSEKVLRRKISVSPGYRGRMILLSPLTGTRPMSSPLQAGIKVKSGLKTSSSTAGLSGQQTISLSPWEPMVMMSITV